MPLSGAEIVVVSSHRTHPLATAAPAVLAPAKTLNNIPTTAISRTFVILHRRERYHGYAASLASIFTVKSSFTVQM